MSLNQMELTAVRPSRYKKTIADHRKIEDFFVNAFLQIESPQDRIVIDLDATDDPLHGHQSGRFFHGYYDRYCFLPLYVFCGDQLLVAYLRRSNIDAAKHAWAILALLVKRLRQSWPQVRIVFRGDSGFCRWRMLRWCERHDVDYIVGLARNDRLLAKIANFSFMAKLNYRDFGEKVRTFTDFQYAAGTWDRETFKAEFDAQQAVLQRTRERVQQLEAELEQLSTQLDTLEQN